MTDELKRLMIEFESELAILKGRVDGLEARVGELEATQFSTTTKLNGAVNVVVGANTFSGSADLLVDDNKQTFGATTFNYDLQLNLDTSFTGKDLLRATLRSGNFDGDSNSFGGAGPSSLSSLEVAFQEEGGPNVVGIDRLFYQAPFGDFTFTFGGRVGQEDMLAIWPSLYPSSTVLDVLTLAGAPGAFNKIWALVLACGGRSMDGRSVPITWLPMGRTQTHKTVGSPLMVQLAPALFRSDIRLSNGAWLRLTPAFRTPMICWCMPRTLPSRASAIRAIPLHLG